MPRSEGFAVMDVSTSVCDDPKFRRLQRESPEHVAVAFTAYIATCAESWKSGRRVSVETGWPAFLPYDPEAVASLIAVGLLDKRGYVSATAWRSWYEPARERRDKARDRWARYNASRGADTTPPPRGNDAATATSVPLRPSVPSEPSAPSVRTAARGMKDDGLKAPRTKEEALHALSEKFQRGELSELEYSRQRKEIA
jgi:hypothetical protein